MMIQGDDASPLQPGIQSLVARGARHFPTELLHEIISLTLSRYLSDVLIAPASTRSWDAIGTLLHVDHHFRSCTLSVLNALWGGNFMDLRTDRRRPKNYTHNIEYLRSLAELVQTNPMGVLPPERYMLSMHPHISPYERLGRYFFEYQARVNISLAEDDYYCHEYDHLSNLTLGISALPKGLGDHMLDEFADYVVDNLLVWARALSFRALVSDAARSVDKLHTQNQVQLMGSPFEDVLGTNMFGASLRDAQQCMQKVCEVAGALGRDEDNIECGVLSRDAVSRNLFETLLPKMRRIQEQGGTGGGVCNTWMSILGVVLTSKERETYGIVPAAFRDE